MVKKLKYEGFLFNLIASKEKYYFPKYSFLVFPKNNQIDKNDINILINSVFDFSNSTNTFSTKEFDSLYMLYLKKNAENRRLKYENKYFYNLLKKVFKTDPAALK